MSARQPLISGASAHIADILSGKFLSPCAGSFGSDATRSGGRDWISGLSMHTLYQRQLTSETVSTPLEKLMNDRHDEVRVIVAVKRCRAQH